MLAIPSSSNEGSALEVSFLINALRRYWWVTVMCMLATAAGTATLVRGGQPTYESRALVIVSPPSAANAALSFAGNSDRYIAGQLNVLMSEEMASRVATSLGAGISSAAVANVLTVAQAPGSDVVELVGQGSSPQNAQRVIQAYVDQYFDLLGSQVQSNQSAEASNLDGQLTDLQNQLDKVDADIKTALAPYVSQADAKANAAAIPDVAQISPALDSRKQLLVSEFTQVLQARHDLDAGSKMQVTSQVIQKATTPTAPLPESSTLKVIAGLFAGAMLGAFISVVLGRASRRVLDSAQAGEILGQPFVGAFPKWRAYAKNRGGILSTLRGPVAQFVDLLCVQAEAHAVAGRPLVVAVVGTQRGAGTTRLAAAMATRYASQALHTTAVLLVDVDANSPELSARFGQGSSGIEGLLELVESPRQASTAVDQRAFVSTSTLGLRLVSVGNRESASHIRRNNMARIVNAAAANADIVVFDAGPVLESASTIELTHLVDVVVLAVPTRHQRVDELVTVSRQLQAKRDALLPVEMPTSSRLGAGLASMHRHSASRHVEAPHDIDADLDAGGRVARADGAAVRDDVSL
jgi:uncharacterized protein involved in exopolysaccharide biosynthesis